MFEGKKMQRNVLHSLTCHHRASQDVDGTVAHIATLLDNMSAKCFYRKEIYLLTYLSVKEKAEVKISVREGRNVSVVFPVRSREVYPRT